MSTPDATAAIEIAPVTLEQLAVTLAIGCGVLVTTLLLFAGAIRLRITVSTVVWSQLIQE